jgi:cytochrome c2
MRAKIVALVALALPMAAAPALAATGQDVFNNNCAGCHALDPAADQTAPPLRGVVGRKIASVTGFPYSDALKAKADDTWTPANLDAFLANPQGFAPGTEMYGGASDPNDRKAIIDYLATQK